MFFNETQVNFLDEELPQALNGSAAKLIQKYNEGYQIGFTWPDVWWQQNNYEPSGPYVYVGNSFCHCRSYDRKGNGCGRQITPRFTCRQQIEYARQSAEENNKWREGWKAGNEERLRLGLSFSVQDHNKIMDEWRKNNE